MQDCVVGRVACLVFPLFYAMSPVLLTDRRVRSTTAKEDHGSALVYGGMRCSWLRVFEELCHDGRGMWKVLFLLWLSVPVGCVHGWNLPCDMLHLLCHSGHITVTDMDNIELSNLNRQFLFRAHHVKVGASFFLVCCGVTAAHMFLSFLPDKMFFFLVPCFE